MLLTKLKIVGLSVAVLIVCGAGALGLRLNAADPREKKADPPAGKRPVVEEVYAPTEAEQKQTATDMKRLQGTWLVVDAQCGGEKPPDGLVNNCYFVFRGDRYSVFVQDETRLGDLFRVGGPSGNFGRVILNAAPVPKTMDMIMKTPVKHSTHGIYALDGDTLRLSSSDNPEEMRPKDFTSKPGSRQTVYVLKRIPQTEEMKTLERLAKFRSKAWRALRDLIDDDDDDEVFSSPKEHQKYMREKLDAIGQVLGWMRGPEKPEK